MKNNSHELSIQSNSKTSIKSYNTVGDAIMVSREKLEHILDMASDRKIDRPFFGTDKFIVQISIAAVFAAAGSLPSLHNYHQNVQIVIISTIIAGLLFLIYTTLKSYQEYKDRLEYKGKLSNKIQEIFDRVDQIKSS